MVENGAQGQNRVEFEARAVRERKCDRDECNITTIESEMMTEWIGRTSEIDRVR